MSNIDTNTPSYVTDSRNITTTQYFPVIDEPYDSLPGLPSPRPTLRCGGASSQTTDRRGRRRRRRRRRRREGETSGSRLLTPRLTEGSDIRVISETPTPTRHSQLKLVITCANLNAISLVMASGSWTSAWSQTALAESAKIPTKASGSGRKVTLVVDVPQNPNKQTKKQTKQTKQTKPRAQLMTILQSYSSSGFHVCQHIQLASVMKA